MVPGSQKILPGPENDVFGQKKKNGNYWLIANWNRQATFSCLLTKTPQWQIFSLGVDKNLTTVPLKPKAPWTKHKSGTEKNNDMKTLLWISQVTRANTNPPHTPRNTRGSNKIHFALCKKTLSPARYVLEDTSCRNRHKIDACDASLLMWNMNWSRLV